MRIRRKEGRKMVQRWMKLVVQVLELNLNVFIIMMTEPTST